MKITSALSASDKIGGAELIYKSSCQHLKFLKVIVHEKIEPQLGIPGAIPIKFPIIKRTLIGLLRFLANYPSLIVRLNRLLKNTNAIYVNDFQGLVYLVWFRVFKKQLQIFYHCHTAFKDTFFNRQILSRFVNWMTNSIIVPSNYLRAELLVIGLRHITTLYNGISTPNAINHTHDKDKIGYESTCQIGILGAISDQKGQDIFILAIEQLLLKKQLRVKAHIAGYSFDETFTKFVLSEISKNPEHIVYHGSLSHQQSLQLISELDIVVCASKYRETLPTVLLEAMAYGKPIIGTCIGGIPEIIEPTRNGILIPPNNPEALVVAIEEIITKNLFHLYSKVSFDIFSTKFSLERYIREMKDILND